MKMPNDFNKLKAAMTAMTLVDQGLALFSKVKLYSAVDGEKEYLIIELDENAKKEAYEFVNKTLKMIDEVRGNFDEVQKRRSHHSCRYAGTRKDYMG
jgi:hypothetical protein